MIKSIEEWKAKETELKEIENNLSRIAVGDIGGIDLAEVITYRNRARELARDLNAYLEQFKLPTVK